jgi:hypothetical protein
MNLYTILAIHIVTTLLNVFFVYPYSVKNNNIMYETKGLLLLFVPILSQVGLCILVGTIIKDWFETKDTVIEVVYKKYLKWFGVDV